MSMESNSQGRQMSALTGLHDKKIKQRKLMKIKTTKSCCKTRDQSTSYNRIRQGISIINNIISKKVFSSLRNNRKFS
jgi:hypothetical protein